MRKVMAILLLLALILSLGVPSVAAPAVQHEYSKEANSGIRNEVCTTLLGTSASSYYTGEYDFDVLSAQSGDALLQTLRAFMTDTHTYKTSYDECRDYADETDCENADGTTINLLYSAYISNFGEYINNTPKGWNREHVWPKSRGGFNTSGAGADLHHIRPTDSSINGQRGNELYGEPASGKQVTGTVVTGNALGGTSDNTYFEPLDFAKGDVARICLYVYVRYGGELSKCASITNIFQSVDVLLSWCEMDPVDTWEMGRNEVVQAIQGNRNVFIDYPELAWLLFDREVPENMQTPTSSMEDPCAEGHEFGEWMVEKPSTEAEGGLRVRTCLTCGEAETEDIPAWSACTHVFGDWVSNEELSGAYCTICGYRQTEYHEAPADFTWVWIVVAVVVIAAAVAVVIVIKKKKQ